MRYKPTLYRPGTKRNGKSGKEKTLGRANAASDTPIHQAYRQALAQEPVLDAAGAKRRLEREEALFELDPRLTPCLGILWGSSATSSVVPMTIASLLHFGRSGFALNLG